MSRVTGQLELRRVARLLREARPELRRELSRNIRKPIKPFEARVKAEVPGSVPDRYAGVLAPSIRVNIAGGLSGSGLGYTLVVYGKGRSEDRDVAAVNARVLRHKTWGRHPWHAQHVRGGFVDRAAEDLGNQVAKEVQEAVETIARKIEGG